jgi:hypothetical protein
MIEIIGLILNVIGALLLAKSADIQAKILNTVIDRVADDNFATYGMVPIPVEFRNDLKKKQKRNQILNITGYVLFSIGAALQLLSLYDK